MNGDKLCKTYTLWLLKTAGSYTAQERSLLMASAPSMAAGRNYPGMVLRPFLICLPDSHRIEKKTQRSGHIHACRHTQMARAHERSKSEVRYCYFCFRWIFTEDWEKHCQMHLDRITSKCCATITYCHSLLRPALCPFCLGGDRRVMSASTRWSS